MKEKEREFTSKLWSSADADEDILATLCFAPPGWNVLPSFALRNRGDTITEIDFHLQMAHCVRTIP